MSNHEIEDVLSSIRRLVSEDLRPASRGPEAAVVPDISDKLLLTPALRVVTKPDMVEPDMVGPDLAGAESDVPESDAPSEGAAAGPVEDVITRLGASVAEEEWESPFGDPEVWPGALDSGPEFVSQGRKPEDLSAGEMPPGVMEAPMAGFAGMEDGLSGFEPESDAEPEPVARTPLRRVSPPQEDNGWADAAEAEVRADLARELEDEVIPGVYEAQPDGLPFDEDMLRDLVRDLIREELSGSLGERITRNVRKLVRAEVARAMALRAFE